LITCWRIGLVQLEGGAFILHKLPFRCNKWNRFEDNFRGDG
jgi:hypothetical protein